MRVINKRTFETLEELKKEKFRLFDCEIIVKFSFESIPDDLIRHLKICGNYIVVSK